MRKRRLCGLPFSNGARGYLIPLFLLVTSLGEIKVGNMLKADVTRHGISCTNALA